MRKRGVYGALLILLPAGMLIFGKENIHATIDYANAKEFYESTGGQNGHIKVLDGDIYFATKGKEAFYGNGLRYTAAGFDICIKGNGKQAEVAVKRGGVLKEVSGTSVQAGGYRYNLYRIALSDIYRLAADKQDFALIMESGSTEILMNAILVIRQGNINLGSIAEDGCGNVTEQGMVFHLKEERAWKLVKRMFSGHNFESYRNIRLSTDWRQYLHTVRYQAGAGNSVERETDRVVRGTAIDLAVKAEKNGWTHIGWNMEPGAKEAMEACVMGEKDITLYAVYRKSVAIAYDTGSSENAIPGATKERFHNASGMYWNPEFILVQGPERETAAFAGWQDAGGSSYKAGETVRPENDMLFTAIWAQYPTILPSESAGMYYVRFISMRFYRNGEEYVPAQSGGLMENSVWKTNEAYRGLLERVFAKQAAYEERRKETEGAGKTVFDAAEETKRFGEQAVDITENSEGDQTWTFTPEQVREVKRFVKENGFGRYLKEDAIEQFYRQFGNCR